MSSILLCAPYAKEPVTLELVGGQVRCDFRCLRLWLSALWSRDEAHENALPFQVISQPYIDMTLGMMADFGVRATRRPGTDIYDIPRGVYRCEGGE